MVSWTIFKDHLLEVGLPNIKPGDRGTPNAQHCWFILFYQARGHGWIEFHWINIWLRERSHMTSHYTWEYGTTLHDIGGVLERPLNTFFRALTISWSRLLARVRSDLEILLDASRWSGRFLGITGWDPSVWKANRLIVDILRFSFINSR